MCIKVSTIWKKRHLRWGGCRLMHSLRIKRVLTFCTGPMRDGFERRAIYVLKLFLLGSMGSMALK